MPISAQHRENRKKTIKRHAKRVQAFRVDAWTLAQPIQQAMAHSLILPKQYFGDHSLQTESRRGPSLRKCQILQKKNSTNRGLVNPAFEDHALVAV